MSHFNADNKFSVVAAGANDYLQATFGEGNNLVAQDPDFAGPADIDRGFDSQGLRWDQTKEKYQFTALLSHIRDYQDWRYGQGQFTNTEADRYLAKFDYWQALGERHWLNVGIDNEQYQYNYGLNAKISNCNADFAADCNNTADIPIESITGDLTVLVNSLYFEDQFNVNNKHTLKFGVNYTQADYLSAGRVEPRLSWNYGFLPNWSTTLAYGQYSQLPDLLQMLDGLGNPNLSTKKSDHYVWGLEQILRDGWSWKTEVYYKEIYDDIVPTGDQRNYSNDGQGTAYGTEIIINKDLTDRWYGWLSISLAETDRENTLTGESFKYQYDKPIMINWVFNRVIGERWMIGGKWSYQSGGLYTPITNVTTGQTNPDAVVPVYGEFNSQRLPVYHQLDLRAEYPSPKNWGYWKFYIDILNAYNRENIEGYSLSPNGVETIDPPAGFGENVPVSASTTLGIFPSIGFEIQF